MGNLEVWSSDKISSCPGNLPRTMEEIDIAVWQ